MVFKQFIKFYEQLNLLLYLYRARISMKNKFAQYIGMVCVFYIPAPKLDDKSYINDAMTLFDLPREILHEYFVINHNAYTHEVSNIKGYWKNQEELVLDQHERYEVSLCGKKNINEFVSFLSRFCHLIQEESIYLTMGCKSWLVKANGFKGSIFSPKK